jgi:hypothetical protein
MNIIASPGSESRKTSPLSFLKFITWCGWIIGSIEIAPISSHPTGKYWLEKQIPTNNGALYYLTY